MAERTDDREVEVSDADLSELEADIDGDAPPASGDAETVLDDDLGVDVDALTADPDGQTTPSGDADASADAASDSESGGFSPGLGGLSGRVTSLPGRSLPDVPSARSFALAIGIVLVAMFVTGSAIPLVSAIPGSGLFGVFAGAFALGLATGRSRYVELLVAGALSGGLGFLFGNLLLKIGSGLAGSMAVFGAGTGAVVALLGHYFGRDLRDGLTKDI